MIGYVLYSLYTHARDSRPPSDGAALVVSIAALLPDAIDKPLAWQFAVLPAGRSLAHSFVFALPLVLVVVTVFRRFGYRSLGSAFAVSYLAHLPADLIYPLVIEGELSLGFLVWPLVPLEPGSPVDVSEHVFELVSDFAAFVTGPRGWQFVLIEAALVGLTLVLWVTDGMPGAGPLRSFFTTQTRS